MAFTSYLSRYIHHHSSRKYLGYQICCKAILPKSLEPTKFENWIAQFEIASKESLVRILAQK